jgi:hypothetical protein
MTPVRLGYEEIAIGNNVQAIEYCLRKGIPLLSVEKDFRYVFWDKFANLDSKLVFWKRGKFLLAMAGLLPGAHEQISSIDIDPEKQTMVVSSVSGVLFEFFFESLRIFESDEIIGLDILDGYSPRYRIIDVFELKTDNSEEILRSCLEREEFEFVKTVFFYPSETKKNQKDLVLDFELTEEQLNSRDYDESSIRILLNRVSQGNPFRIKHKQRIKSKFDQREFAEYPNIAFDKRTFEEIVKQTEVELFDYTRKLEYYLCPRKNQEKDQDTWQESSSLHRKDWISNLSSILRFYQSLKTLQQQKERL